jgi:hypothetical protein
MWSSCLAAVLGHWFYNTRCLRCKSLLAFRTHNLLIHPKRMNLAHVAALRATNLELLVNYASAMLTLTRSLDQNAAALNAPQT